MSTVDDSDLLAEELRALLSSVGAQPKDLTPLPGQEERAEQRLAETLATPKAARPRPLAGAPSRRRRRGRTALMSGLVVAAAAVLAVVLVLQPGTQIPPAQAGTPPLLSFELAPDGRLPGSSGPVGSTLDRLAAARATQVSPGEGDVQLVSVDAWWASTEVEGDTEEPDTKLVPVHTDTYFLPNGTMRVIERRGAPLTSQGRIDAHVDLTAEPITSDDAFPSPDPGPNYAAGLPTTAAELTAALAADDDPALCGDYSVACLVNDVIDLHRSYVVPPAVDAAFWSALSEEPAVTYLGHTTDRIGRKVIAFTTPSYDKVSQIVIFADPETGAFLGDELVLTSPSDAYSFHPPAVTSFTAIVDARYVERDALPDR